MIIAGGWTLILSWLNVPGDHATRCEVRVAGYELLVDAMYPIEYIYIVYDMYTFTYITFTYIYTYTYTYVYTVYIYVFMLLRSKS